MIASTTFAHGSSAKAKNLFDVALKDPDEMGPWIEDRDVDNELLGYVAVEIMQQRQGSDPRELSDCNPDAGANRS
jgi:hypothetical protein